jgi:multiple sugar transport system permease protein
MKLTRQARLVLFGPAALLLGGWLVVPAVLGLGASFTTYSPFASAVHFAGLRNSAAALFDPTFGAAVRNVVIFTIVAVPLELAIGFVLAWLLRHQMPRRSLLRVLLLLPWLVSPIASGVMWHFLYGTSHGFLGFLLGWLGRSEVSAPTGDVRLALTATIAVEVWRMAPFVTFLLLPGVASIPAQRLEDATLSGVNWLHKIFDVVLPSLRPLLLAVTMLLVGLSIGTFDAVLILTGGGPGDATLTPALYGYRQAFVVNDWATGAASGWLIAAAVLAIGLVYIGLTRAEPET